MEPVKRKQRGGWKPKSFMEQKVMVYHTVKRKHHAEAMAEIKELCKKYR